MESFYNLFKDKPEEKEFDADNYDSVMNLSINSLKSKGQDIYYDKKKFDFKEIKIIAESHNIDKLASYKLVLEQLAELEQIILIKIKISHSNRISKFHHKLLKDMAFNLLEQKFREYPRYQELYKQIKIIFVKFFQLFEKEDSLIELVDSEQEILKMLNNDSPNQIERSSNSLTNVKKFNRDREHANSIFSIIKKLYKKNMSLLTDKLNNFFGIENFPFFLVRVAKYKIKKKINKKYIPKFKEIYLRNEFFNSLEYLLTVEKIKDISQKKLEIFDEKILNLEIRETLLRIIILTCNSIYSSVWNDSFYSKSYLDNIHKYLFALNIDVNFDNLGNGSNSISPEFLNDLDTIPNEMTHTRISYLNKIIGITNVNANAIVTEIESNNCSETLKELFKNLEESIKLDLDKYLFIILSLSILFNNYDLNQKIIIKVSSREKECLRRILLLFNENYRYENLDIWKFNQILESVIFSHYFKSSYSNNISCEINQNQEEKVKKTAHKTKIGFYFINEIINSNPIINEQLISEYNCLISNIPQKKNSSCCQSLLKFFKEFFFPYQEKEVIVNLQYTALIPYDKYNYSNHVCILIPGFISSNHNNHKQWENFIIDFDTYVDFYFYLWDSKTGIKIINDIMKFLGGLSLTLLTRNFLNVFSAYRTYQHKNNLFAKTTKISKYCGKLLAYFLASKTLFEKRSITLVGFSLGGNILKSCLKELFNISTYLPEVKDLVQNIVFIGAATSIPDNESWKKINHYVSGRIINCYCPNDEVLQGIFKYITKKDPLGIRPLNFENVEFTVENYDFTELHINHVEYKCYLNEIIEKINLF